MILNFKKYSLNLIILMAVLFVLHFMIYRAAPGFLSISIKMVFEIYGFLILLNLVHFIALKWLFKKWAKHAGLLFTALSLLKMGICILYLWPYMLSTTSSLPVVLNFMAVYFATLVFEVVFIVKNMLNSAL